jgi:hypothetical protein
VYDLAGGRRLGCRRDWVLVKVTAEGENPTTWEEMVGGSVGAPGGARRDKTTALRLAKVHP